MAAEEGFDGQARRTLLELARLALAPPGPGARQQVATACALIGAALGAAETYVLRSGDPDFVRLDSGADPQSYEIKQRGYYLIWQALAREPFPAPAGVQVRERFVEQVRPLRAGEPATHVAAALPAYESNSELVILRGPWPDGLSDAQIDVLCVAQPLLSSLAAASVDAERQQRQRTQLGLLAGVMSTLGNAEQLPELLDAIATALATASGIDWVTIDLLDPALTPGGRGSLNVTRHSQTQTARQFWQLPGRDAAMRFNLRRIGESGRPLLVPDVFAPREGIDDPDVLEYFAALRRYHERAHVLSTATFTLTYQNELLGVLSFASSTRREFGADEVEFLSALVAQAATAIGSLRLTTAQRTAEEARARLEGVILAARGLAHEINQDLGVIVGRADVLQLLVGDAQPRLLAQLNPIQDAAQRVSATIKQLQGTWQVVTQESDGVGAYLDVAASSDAPTAADSGP